MWRPNIPVQILGSNRNMLTVFVYSVFPCQAFVLTMVYEPSRFHEKSHFWHYMSDLADSIIEPWLLVGDFNSISFQFEKHGGKPFSSSFKSSLLQFSNAAGLIDLSFNGSLFTWNNSRIGGANIKECLDRGLANNAW